MLIFKHTHRSRIHNFLVIYIYNNTHFPGFKKICINIEPVMLVLFLSLFFSFLSSIFTIIYSLVCWVKHR